MVLVLTLVTCGIYGIYWHWATSGELRDATGDTTINPTLDLVLLILTCGVWGIFLDYRIAQKVHEALKSREPTRTDQSQTVLILGIAALFVGVTMWVATYIAQDELNKLARAA